ncbi:Uncharacterised protein [Acinetobacter baumannii]|nr:Uncharacterised protein [Acinetobacter baumannii]
MQPSLRQPVGAEHGLQALHRDRVEIGEMQVVLAGPLHAQVATGERLGQDRRFQHEVGLGLAAETAAEQGHVDRDLVERQFQALGDALAGHLRRLGRGPDLAGAVLVPGGGDRRFHRRLGQVRQVVLGLDDIPAPGEQRRGIAAVAHHLARLARGLFQLLAVGHRVVAAVDPGVPLDHQRLAPLDRRPGVLRHHGDPAQRLELGRDRPALDLDHLDHPRHLQRRGGVVALELAAVDRRPGDHGVEHVVEARVEAEAGAAIDDIGAVDGARHVLADVAELLGLLQQQLVARRHFETRGGLGQFAEGQRTAAGRMQHLVLFGAALAQRDLPLVGRGLFEHLSRRRTAAAHGFEPMAHAARAIGVLVAVARFVAGRLDHLDPAPVGLQLVGHHHRQAGAHALSHFRAVADDADRAVPVDAHVDLRVVYPAVGHGVGAEGLLLGGQGVAPAPVGSHQQHAGGADALEETAAAEIADDQIVGVRALHALASCNLAEALWIAVLIRL